MEFTIVGAGGFLGRALADRVEAAGHSVRRALRGADLFSAPLGHLIYAAGVTADFRTRPAETVDAHVSLLMDILARARFSSLLYLSSTRVYRRASSGHETAVLSCSPDDPEDLYNLSKALGESLCLARGTPDIRVVRLSNVIGAGNPSPSFFQALLSEAQSGGRIRIEAPASAAKDYVCLDDVVSVLPEIAVRGRERLYNVASGACIANAEIAAQFEAAGVRVEFSGNAAVGAFPAISIRRVQDEFGFSPRPVLPLMRALIDEQLRRDDKDRP